MTPLSLAPPPAPHETAALPLPTPPEVVALQAVRSYPAVSVLCSTEPGPRMTPVDAARLADLVGDAEARLVEEFGPTATAELRDRLRAAAVDASGRATRAAVALFVGDHAIGSWALSVPVSSRAVVDPTFATRDLVRSLHRTPRHVVLVLTEHEARLFDGIGESLVPAVGGSFPMVRQRSAGRRAPARGAAGDAETFLRDVDRALGTYLRLHPAPLLLVGALRTVATFVRLSRNTRRLAGRVQGSHARTPLPVLAELLRPVLERYLRSRQGEALQILETRAGAGRVVTGMPSVWLAARAERPEMLAVEEGFFYPARLSDDGDLIVPANDLEHPDVVDDAVDEVIETVLQRGGWVAWVDDGTLADAGGIALSVRR